MKRIITFIILALIPLLSGYAQETTPKINKKNLVVKEWNTNGKGVAQTLDHVTTYSAEGKKIEEIEYDSVGKQKWRKNNHGRTKKKRIGFEDFDVVILPESGKMLKHTSASKWKAWKLVTWTSLRMQLSQGVLRAGRG